MVTIWPINEAKLPVTLFISQVLGSFLFLMLKKCFQSSGIYGKRNFEVAFIFKSHTVVLTFTFSFSSFAFLASCFFLMLDINFYRLHFGVCVCVCVGAGDFFGILLGT